MRTPAIVRTGARPPPTGRSRVSLHWPRIALPLTPSGTLGRTPLHHEFSGVQIEPLDESKVRTPPSMDASLPADDPTGTVSTQLEEHS